MSKVLLAGESWVTHSIHIKGFDSFTTSEYVEGAGKLIEALEAAGHRGDVPPQPRGAGPVPPTAEELAPFDAVILSDIGANSLLLHPRTFTLSESRPNRIAELVQYVRNGGGLAMIGGYLSFSGIEGKAGYPRTELADVLPVIMTEGDDRREAPQGVSVEGPRAGPSCVEGNLFRVAQVPRIQSPARAPRHDGSCTLRRGRLSRGG